MIDSTMLASVFLLGLGVGVVLGWLATSLRTQKRVTELSTMLETGSFQTIWKDPNRYVHQYYARYCKNRDSRDWRDWPYMAGDGALQAADGYYRILGRIDDVINVAGHRLGTKEIESASLLVDEVAEAAVIPARDEIKGKVPDLYVSLKPGLKPSEDIRKRVEASV